MPYMRHVANACLVPFDKTFIFKYKKKNIMRNIMLLPILLFVLSANHSMAQQPRDIVQKSIDVIKTDAMEITSTLDIYNNRGLPM